MALIVGAVTTFAIYRFTEEGEQEIAQTEQVDQSSDQQSSSDSSQDQDTSDIEQEPDEQQDPLAIKTYTNSDYIGFSFDYPGNWKVEFDEKVILLKGEYELTFEGVYSCCVADTVDINDDLLELVQKDRFAVPKKDSSSQEDLYADVYRYSAGAGEIEYREEMHRGYGPWLSDDNTRHLTFLTHSTKIILKTTSGVIIDEGILEEVDEIIKALRFDHLSDS